MINDATGSRRRRRRSLISPAAHVSSVSIRRRSFESISLENTAGSAVSILSGALISCLVQ